MGRKTKTNAAAVEAVEPEAIEQNNEPQAEAPAAPQQDTMVRRSVVPLRWAKAYAKSELKGTCDDALAHQLDAITKTDGKPDRAKIDALGWANGIDVQKRWGERNIGMQRMNLGNVLRGRIKRGEAVTIAI